MTIEFNVCAPDMEDCSKKCKFGSSLATSCTEPCGCRGNEYYLDRFRGKCVYRREVPPSCVETLQPGGGGGVGMGDGGYCTDGYTLVSACYSFGLDGTNQTTGCSNYGSTPVASECTYSCSTARIWDAAYQDDIDYGEDGGLPAGVGCRRWGYSASVYGLSGILLVPDEPYVDDYTRPGPYRNRATCGAPSRIFVFAKSAYGLVYVDYYYLPYYYTPFSFFTTLTNVNALIRTMVIPSQCYSCGNEGQPECPSFQDALTEGGVTCS